MTLITILWTYVALGGWPLVRSIDHIILPKYIRTSGWSGIQKSVNGTPGLDSDLTWSVGLERVQLQL